MKNLPLVLLLVLPACAMPEPKAPPPGLAASVTKICDVDRLAGIDPDRDVLDAGAKRTAYLNEHDQNPDGIELRTLLSVKGASDQAKMLRESAKEAGTTRCALADVLEKTGIGGLAP